MSDNTIDTVRGFLLALVIGIVGAILLANWAACEQDDSVCIYTGVGK